MINHKLVAIGHLLPDYSASSPASAGPFLSAADVLVAVDQLSGDCSRNRDTTRQASQILSFRSEIRHMYVAHHNLIFKQQKSGGVIMERSNALRNNLMKIIDQWPLAMIVFGGILTLIWLGMLIWLPLSLLV